MKERPSEKFKRDVRKLLDDALEENPFNICLAAAKHLRAYGRNKHLLKSATYFAIEKLSEHGYMFEPINDDSIIILIKRKK